MRISEIYMSIQGEGPRVGSPTVFVRFGGCNLRCASWPCDTQHAIDPTYRHEWKQATPELVHKWILEKANGHKSYNVCFTGGEPFLQPKDELNVLIDMLLNDRIKMECFSNGALPYTPLAITNVSFIMDWKLPGSGELTYVDNRIKNFMDLWYDDVVKFTIRDRLDYDAAKGIYAEFAHLNKRPQWYYGRVWGTPFEEKHLVELVLKDKLPWKHTMQVHNIIWDRSQRGI